MITINDTFHYLVQTFSEQIYDYYWSGFKYANKCTNVQSVAHLFKSTIISYEMQLMLNYRAL